MSTENGGAASQQEQRIRPLDIREEMQKSYLTYAMSVIVSRALPDVRDGLKPSQRRILVAMHDLNLGPGSARVKCSKIVGDTNGNYHPHGDQAIYPTLVRMAQEWVMREVLVDKQGNFGSLAGLPPAAMRYTEARLSPLAAEMLRDLELDTVDFVPTYDQSRREPVVLPSRFPNLLVNGSSGIAVGMATSIPPHNLSEVADAVMLLIDNPEATIDDILEVLPGPDFPTGGVICGRSGIRRGYMSGRSTITVRARTHLDKEKDRDVIVVTEIPYMETRDRIREKLEALVRENRVQGIANIVDLTDRNVPPWQVRLHIVLRRDADPDVVLQQLFRYSPLQSTFSIILLALVGNRPKFMSIKELLQEFIRHRVAVIRRRTEHLLAEARKRKHTVEGLLVAQVDIDQVIQTIRNSPSRAEACNRLRQIAMPAELVARALGEEGFRLFQAEYGVRNSYSLSAKQAQAIVSMQLGSLANLEREQLREEFHKLIEEIKECQRLLSDEANILEVVKSDMQELKQKYGNPRRTDISDEEATEISVEDLIQEEPMVVTLTQRGYIKRTELHVYKAQNRGGRGVTGARTDQEDPIKDVFVASTHDYLLFFTDKGRVYWRKVFDLPLQGRAARGRAVVNLLSLQPDEKIAACLPVRDFDGSRFLVMATRRGMVKKTELGAYSRPKRTGIIAIKLDEGDSLVDVGIVGAGDDILLATANGMAIRFAHEDVRPMGRNTRGVQGIRLDEGDYVVGMVVARPDLTLLTVCEKGYGKRTPIGPGETSESHGSDDEQTLPTEKQQLAEQPDSATADQVGLAAQAAEQAEPTATDEDHPGSDDQPLSSTKHYRRQRRGGKGLIDIRTTERNGKVMDVVAVDDEDEVLLISAQGKIQRIRAGDVSLIGRNTQGVRIMRLDEGDRLVALARIPREVLG